MAGGRDLSNGAPAGPVSMDGRSVSVGSLDG